MRQALYAGCVTAILFLTSCATSSTVYSRYMFEGKKEWQAKDYAQAKADFLKAYEVDKRVAPLAWAATTSYWLNDLASAERYLQEAEANREFKKGFSYFRIMGYRALVLLRQGKKSEGLAVLKTYVDAYDHTFPSSNTARIAFMVRKGEVDLPRLEVMVEDDVWEYEQGVEQFESGRTGYYDRNSGAIAGGVR
jgi:tetratricopeptide (TPR) repeat protein